jgi:hypothetical protein
MNVKRFFVGSWNPKKFHSQRPFWRHAVVILPAYSAPTIARTNLEQTAERCYIMGITRGLTG